MNSNIPINTGNAFYLDELQKFTLPYYGDAHAPQLSFLLPSVNTWKDWLDIISKHVTTKTNLQKLILFPADGKIYSLQ